jgi:hypothetical protein
MLVAMAHEWAWPSSGVGVGVGVGVAVGDGVGVTHVKLPTPLGSKVTDTVPDTPPTEQGLPSRPVPG